MSPITFVAACVALSAAHPSLTASEEPRLSVPSLTDNHRQFLSHLARRTARDVLLGHEAASPEYVPAALQAIDGEAVVRIREHGYFRAAGAGGAAPLATAVLDAAASAARSLRADPELGVESLSRMLIEIELIGAAEPIPVPDDWSRPGALQALLEPGIHGLGIRGSVGVQRVCPTEFIASGVTLSEAAKRLAAFAQGPEARLARFRTLHWYEASAGAPIVTLQRGLTLIPPDAVTAANLDESIARLAEYLTYRQRKSGLFSDLFDAASDRYIEEDGVVRQAGAAAAIALHARHSGRAESLSAANLAVEHYLRHLTEIPARDHAAFIATEDKSNKLGVTALVAVALAEHPNRETFAARREKLINGMLWLQRPSGLFITAFPPARSIEGQDYFPGEALLALATHYSLQPSAEVLDAFDRAIRYYRAFFRDRPSPAFIPWQTQAFALMARHTKRRDYADFAFELTDWAASKQLQPSNCPWPELWGEIGTDEETPGTGVSTGAFLEGFAAALMLARFVGDAERERTYDALVRGSARFVMQLQVRPEEAYFMRSPRDAVGGIRAAPARPLLRIDHSAHGLIGLIQARRALTVDQG